jgi:outer membrane protein insertion porin family
MAGKLEIAGGQPFEQSAMQKDTQWVQDLYGSHGFIFADVKPETVFLEEPGQVDLVYHIDEGQRWRVGRIFVHIGGDNPHTRIQTALNRVTLRPGEIFDIRELKASERRLMHSSLFHVDAATGQRPKITYRIPEDADLEFAEGRRGGLRGQNPSDPGPPVLAPPSMAATARTPSEGAQQPPEGPDLHVYCEDYNAYLLWVAAESELNAREAGRMPPPRAEGQEEGLNNHDATPLMRSLPASRPSPDSSQPGRGIEAAAAPADEYSFRGQSPEPTPTGNWLPQWRSPQQPEPQTSARPQIRSQSPGGFGNFAYAAVGGASAPGNVNQAYAAVPAAQPSPYGGQVVRATGPESVGPPTSAVQPAQYSPQLQPPAGSIAPTPLNPRGPLPGFTVDPLGPTYAAPSGTLPSYPEGLVDVHIEGSETQTGRLMLGVGVNSDAGVVGNIVIDERNFDWGAWPRSFEDFRTGQAFRGDGQRLRIDASPGSQVSRYLVSFQDPYWMDQPISLGLSGSYFDRRFRDWDEQRIGGRVALGYQWVERDLSATIAYRGENINIHDPSVPLGVVPELDEVLGDNSLHGFKLTVIRDTRDNPFLATKGTYFEIGGEQVVGSFDYPRVEMDVRKYWLLHERPDHSGRHVFSLSSTVGYSGTHTPIYEHFFAGGFATMRGFDFRGASPVFNGVEVGGEFQWLNSAQYMFPITADEMLHGVVFCDFGTVERDVAIRDFRVAPGVGLRITVPAMGPAPIALDFAFPVARADFDDRQVFSFSLGFSK